jgi:hypothetical protein
MNHDFPDFVPTKFSTIEDKEKFAAHFQKFVLKDYRRVFFYKWFYQRLSMTFGMIAHYNMGGFYSEYFEDAEGKRRFLQECLNWPCYGSAEFTYSDVEEYLQTWLKEYLEGHKLK